MVNLNPFSIVSDVAGICVNNIDLDRLLQAKYQYSPLIKVLPELFVASHPTIATYYNMKGAVCLDTGHHEAVYLVTEPPYIRLPLQKGKLPIKIGLHNKGTLLKRIRELGHRREHLQVLAFVSVPNASLVEKALHNFYDNHHVGKEAMGTEWFDVDPIDAVEAALWMSILCCLGFATEGELIDNTWLDVEASLDRMLERTRRLKLIRRCVEEIDPKFRSQGTRFPLGKVRGRGFESRNRPRPLTSDLYPNFPVCPSDPDVNPSGQLNLPIFQPIYKHA